MQMFVPMDSDEYKQRFFDGGEEHILLDVRSEEEFEEIRVPGAVLIPLQDLSWRYDEVIDETSATPIVIICRSGVRSMMGAQILRQNGITADIYNFEGGTNDWVQRGYTYESDME